VGWFELFIHWCVSGVALLITAAVVPGFRMKGFSTALVAALLIGAANFFVRPVLIILTFPLTILTLGLFVFVVDALILRMCAAFLKDFEISGWLSAIFGAFVLTLANAFLHWFFI
jgi:putative membrane protein